MSKVVPGYMIKEICDKAGIDYAIVGKIVIGPSEIEFYHYVKEETLNGGGDGYKMERYEVAGEQVEAPLVEKLIVDIDWGLVV